MWNKQINCCEYVKIVELVFQIYSSFGKMLFVIITTFLKALPLANFLTRTSICVAKGIFLS